MLEGKAFDSYGCGDCVRSPRMHVGWKPRMRQIGEYRNHGTCKVVERHVDCLGNVYYKEVS